MGSPELGVRLALGLVVASLAARRTVIKTVMAQADIDLSLTEGAVLLAFTLIFGLLALHAAVFRFAGSGAHEENVSRESGGRKCRR